MPASFVPALGLIRVPRWTHWAEISRSRITLRALAARGGYALIDIFALQGVPFADDVTMSALVEAAERSSARVLLVAGDVPLSYVAPLGRDGRLTVTVIEAGLFPTGQE